MDAKPPRNHSEPDLLAMAALFDDTRAALHAGDVEMLARLASEALEDEVDRLVDELPA